MFHQEYIRDKSVQPRIRTVNHILQKWHSETSSVGMVMIILFLDNAWIQLLSLAKVAASLFAGEIELNTCCVAMVKLLGESCRVVDGSGAPDWPKSTLAILVLSLVEQTECRAGVQAIVAKQNWSARARQQVLTTSTTITAFPKTQMLLCLSPGL